MESELTDKEYGHAQDVWSSYYMCTFIDYHDVYFKTDVLLLADVFKNCRNLSQQYYELDRCKVYTAAGFAWNTMLNMTGVQLELLTDPGRSPVY